MGGREGWRGCEAAVVFIALERLDVAIVSEGALEVREGVLGSVVPEAAVGSGGKSRESYWKEKVRECACMRDR